MAISFELQSFLLLIWSLQHLIFFWRILYLLPRSFMIWKGVERRRKKASMCKRKSYDLKWIRHIGSQNKHVSIKWIISVPCTSNTHYNKKIYKRFSFFSFSQPCVAHFAVPQIFAVQHVDVCMFSNGKFKNIVAEVDVSKQIGPGETLHGVYSLLPIRGKHWCRCRSKNEHPIHDSFMTAGTTQCTLRDS